MKTAFSIFTILMLANSFTQAKSMLRIDYNGYTSTKNSYKDSSGNSFTSDGTSDARFLGIGYRYSLPTSAEKLMLEPGFHFMNHIENNTFRTYKLYEVSFGVNFQYNPTQAYSLALLYTQVSDGTSLTYKPAIGYQIEGRQVLSGPHSIYANFNQRNFKSENPPSVNDQTGSAMAFGFGYAYEL